MTAIVVACHWRHPAAGHRSTAERVHESLGRGLHRLVTHVEADFLLDVLSSDGNGNGNGNGNGIDA